MGLRNRLSVLNEQYPYVDFEARVRGAYDLFRTFLDYLHENKEEVVDLVRAADRRTVERGRSTTPGGFRSGVRSEAIDFTSPSKGTRWR